MATTAISVRHDRTPLELRLNPWACHATGQGTDRRPRLFAVKPDRPPS